MKDETKENIRDWILILVIATLAGYLTHLYWQ